MAMGDAPQPVVEALLPCFMMPIISACRPWMSAAVMGIGNRRAAVPSDAAVRLQLTRHHTHTALLRLMPAF